MFSAAAKWASAGFLAFGFVFVAPARGDDAAGRDAILKLLDVGWATTPQARTAADLQYQEVQRLAAGDTQGLAASALVLMQQRRYDEALKRVDQLLVKDVTDLTGLRARIWLQAVLKNYSGAMFTSGKLSERLAAAPPKTEAEQATHDELIAFLGRMFGYFGGPASEIANQDERKAAEKQIVARLEESKRPVFEEARDGVLQKFLELSDSQAQARETALAEAATEKEKTLAELDADRQKMADRVKELDEVRKKLESELKAELAQIAKEDAPLVQQLARLNSQAAIVNQNLANYAAEIGRLRALAASTNDPALKQQYLFEADQLSFSAGRLEATLVGLENQAAGVQAQRNALALRAQRAQAAANDQANQINGELTALAKREKRNDGIERRTTKPASGTTSKGRALSAQATALSTYDQFPLEVARQKLLESLR
jgi:hypothetical protein